VLFLLDLPPPASASDPWTSHLPHLDIPGTLLFIPGVTSLLLAIQWGGTTYEWSNWRIILLFVLFGIIIIAWTMLQYRLGDRATLPARIIRQRSIWVGLAHIFVVGGTAFVVAYFVPIWFQAVQGISAQDSGIRYLAVSLPGALFAVVSGVMVHSPHSRHLRMMSHSHISQTTRIGYYNPSMYIGTITGSIGAGLLLRLHVDSPLADWLPPLLLLGMSTGFAFQTGILAAQTVLSSAADVSIGTSAMVLAQTLGGALFLCVAQAVFQDKTLSLLAERAPGVDPALLLAAGASSRLQDVLLAAAVPMQAVQIVLGCFNDSLREVWVVVLAMSAVSGLGAVGMEWRSVKARKDEVETTLEEKLGSS
jgi:hypothetical protein